MTTEVSKTLIPVEEIERNFREIEPALSDTEARLEAQRCLYCYDAPCTQACPTHIDVPAFIKKIASGNVMGSARVIFNANPIGASCARVCPVEALCVGACVENTLMHQPIMIGRLQRYATDHAMREGAPQLFKPNPHNGKSVGIIGSGPAGLSCAAFLARLGYQITIYEQKEKAGGLDTYGMAEYKMAQIDSLTEVSWIERMGVEIKCNTKVGTDVTLEELETRHEAIFLAVGLGATSRLHIPGEDLPGVYEALDFIDQVKTRQWENVPIATSVAVIGAGNTSVDAVTQAKRLGAEHVIMVYRRSQKEMPAYHYEYELAKSDAVEFQWQTAPVAIIPNADNSGIAALRCVRTQLAPAAGKSKRAEYQPVPGSEFEIPVQMVIKALGQQKRVSFLETIPGINLDPAGRVKVTPESMQTSNPKYFAGGDCVNGGREAVDAAQHGKIAARGIHFVMTGERIQLAGLDDFKFPIPLTGF
ncbi:MAG: NAD(P)-dependent oxidoreductase [Blastocatellia bacterium]|nr:NAD(P)-dependent oxidoreductase [Blastocatellia bacterium]